MKYINKNSKSLILNCGYGKPYSVLDIANILKRKNSDTQINYKNRRPGDIAKVYSNTKKFDKILSGFEVDHVLFRGGDHLFSDSERTRR